MIASHGPTEKTQNDFWKMIISENVTKIVSLCEKMGDDYINYDEDNWKLKILDNFESDSKKPVSQYFPNDEKKAIVFDKS